MPCGSGHLVLTDPEGVLPDFMAWLNRQLAMCIKRLRGWEEVVWEPNVAYSAVELSGPTEVLDKVAYVLLNPVSAGLVQSPERWPGAVSTLGTLRRATMTAKRPAVWFKDNAPKEVSLALTVPRCFEDRVRYRGVLEALMKSRLAEVQAELRRQGRGFLGRNRVRKTKVTDQPATKKPRFGRNPIFSALTRRRGLRRSRRSALSARRIAWHTRRGEVGRVTWSFRLERGGSSGVRERRLRRSEDRLNFERSGVGSRRPKRIGASGP